MRREDPQKSAIVHLRGLGGVASGFWGVVRYRGSSRPARAVSRGLQSDSRRRLESKSHRHRRTSPATLRRYRIDAARVQPDQWQVVRVVFPNVWDVQFTISGVGGGAGAGCACIIAAEAPRSAIPTSGRGPHCPVAAQTWGGIPPARPQPKMPPFAQYAKCSGEVSYSHAARGRPARTARTTRRIWESRLIVATSRPDLG